MTAESPTPASILSGVAAILQAIAWPSIAAVFFLVYRPKLGSLIDTLALKLRQAKHLKAGQIEIDTAEEIHQVIAQTGAEAGGHEILREIPKSQLQAAQVVGEKLNAAPISFSQKLDVAHQQLFELINQYEQARRDLPGGPARTRVMNEIAAKMRALAVAARPLLTSLLGGQRPGERLAAICTLQVSPELGYFDWLIERVMKEDQPFVFFHASLAILELVKSYPYFRPESAIHAVRAALDRVNGFRGGHPDMNTIGVLSEALAQLTHEQAAHAVPSVSVVPH